MQRLNLAYALMGVLTEVDWQLAIFTHGFLLQDWFASGVRIDFELRHLQRSFTLVHGLTSFCNR